VKVIEHFDISYYQYLNEKSELALDAPAIAQDQAALLTLYRQMLLTRLFDAKAIALQRTGKLGTYPSTRGQEAVFVGMGHTLLPEDVFVPYYRDVGTLLARGVSLTQVLLYWGGDERGNDFGKNNFPYSVPVGSQPLHAAGAAFALKYRELPNAALGVCGDGATSQGDFYEAMNIAGAWQLPVVFVICNNQWAISVSRTAQTAAKTLAQKAIAAGIPGEQVDGNDVIAVTARVAAALQAAREKREPRVLEMLCYRQHDHTTADDASRYEPKIQREQEWAKEPIQRLRLYLEAKKWLNQAAHDEMEATSVQAVEIAVEQYLATPPQPATSMFDHLYANLPPIYQAQRDLLVNKEVSHG